MSPLIKDYKLCLFMNLQKSKLDSFPVKGRSKNCSKDISTKI